MAVSTSSDIEFYGSDGGFGFFRGAVNSAGDSGGGNHQLTLAMHPRWMKRTGVIIDFLEASIINANANTTGERIAIQGHLIGGTSQEIVYYGGTTSDGWHRSSTGNVAPSPTSVMYVESADIIVEARRSNDDGLTFGLVVMGRIFDRYDAEAVRKALAGYGR